MSTNGTGRLPCAVEGEGPPLLLIPGVAAGGRSWGALLNALRRRFTCLVLDAPGSGPDGACAGSLTTAAMAADSVSVLDALGVGTVHVLGFSLGGMVAQTLAIRHPDRIGRLVLAHTGARVEGSSAVHVAALKALAERDDMPAFVEGLLERSFTERFRSRCSRSFAAFRLAFTASAPSAAAVLAQIAALQAHDARGDAGRIQAPALVLSAREDVLMPPEAGADLAQRTPGAELRVLPEGGHAAYVEETAAFADAVVEHLCRTKSSGVR